MDEVITLPEFRFFEWHEDDISVTLRERGGSYGGQRSACNSETVGALCARDCKGVGNQYVEEGKLIVQYRK